MCTIVEYLVEHVTCYDDGRVTFYTHHCWVLWLFAGVVLQRFLLMKFVGFDFVLVVVVSAVLVAHFVFYFELFDFDG